MPATPRSQSLSTLLPSPKHSFVALQHHHIAVIVFVLVWFFVWLLLFTFHPTFILSDEDFLSDFNQKAVSGSNAEDNDNKLLSDKGRTAIFLWSLVIALIIAVVSYLLMRRYS